jgi:diketogulonate reductase-like aldo/keto reductase
MPQLVLLHDGTRFPWPVYGSGTSLRDTDASEHIAGAIRAGFRHIDCAQMYQNEESVGRGIARSSVPRPELYVTTKLLPVAEGLTVKDTLRETLRKMGLDYVDLVLLHEPVGHRDLKTTWREVEECKMLGLAKSIGVSNFRIQDLEEIRETGASVPVINQVREHLTSGLKLRYPDHSPD